jgi:hypothetical protein
MKSNPNMWKPYKFYLIHHNNNYDTKDYYALKKDRKIDHQELPLIVCKEGNVA